MYIKFKVIFINFFLCINFLYAQNELPKLNLIGRTADSFVPVGWNIISKSEGDLNKDNLDDLALVISKNKEISNEGASVPTEVNDRILGVFIKKKDGSYIKQLQSDTFIIPREDGMYEPFQGIQITSEGTLEINFQIWREKMKWFVASYSYKFLLQNQSFNLIGFNLNETNRETGESTDYIIDFTLKKMSITNYNYIYDKVPTTENIKFKLDSLKNIETLKTPFSWVFQGLNI